jgi:hypothetical protein
MQRLIFCVTLMHGLLPKKQRLFGSVRIYNVVGVVCRSIYIQGDARICLKYIDVILLSGKS